ncbi:hypothetical protein [Maribacter polysaccharolyticus]|uniref:hypothetical protein n=1 Tax=Maribacter polysaccharolyticus TaxID=3020831 RepID=UPI00237F562F|nr:hypothetical protein [Maribacter polysaccharolyticus]MDE3740403.1 hypothetical protein [Maribacter polysaccharolyticus]
MKFISRFLSWKRTIVLAVIVLLLLNVFNFYGLYTNRFYFFKIDNYILPLLTLVHFTFLYALRFKIHEKEIGDPQMRNLEFTLYAIFLIYIYKLVETVGILMSYSDYESNVIPDTFIPIGILITTLYVIHLVLTLVTFGHRKALVGDYDFNKIHDRIDYWE